MIFLLKLYRIKTMNKINIIIQREYLTRVRKKSFIIMTIIGPVLMAALILAPIVLKSYANETKNISVLDESALFLGRLSEKKSIKFNYLPFQNLKQAKQVVGTEYDALLYIPIGSQGDINFLEKSIQLYSNSPIGINTRTYLQKEIESILEEEKMKIKGLDKKTISAIKSYVNISYITIDGDGNETKNFDEISMLVGGISGALIYFFIFLFGAQVMRGVIEEKSNRIVEIIISSVKPFQLMLGKIIGIACVGLTQFALWILLTLGIIFIAQSTFIQNKYDVSIIGNNLTKNQIQLDNAPNAEVLHALEGLFSINIPLILGMFVFFFIGGYLLYAALFAAIGAAVDNETDTQQFMLPITIPLILGFIIGSIIIEDPNSSLAFWFSIIPFTSPIVMMARLPFGIPYWEVLIAAFLLIIGFLITTYIAARIYRVGILMYGKKTNYYELWKWLKYKG